MLTEKQEASLTLLSASYGITQAGDAAAVVTAFELALAQQPEQDIDAAFALLLSGTAPGQNTNFMPAAPFVGALVRNIRDGRLERELKHQAAIKQILARDVVKDGTELTRKQEVAEAMQRSHLHAPEPEKGAAELLAEAEAKRKHLAAHDELFGLNDRTDEQIRRELLGSKLGYSVGDRVADHDAG